MLRSLSQALLRTVARTSSRIATTLTASVPSAVTPPCLVKVILGNYALAVVALGGTGWAFYFHWRPTARMFMQVDGIWKEIDTVEVASPANKGAQLW